MQTRLLFLFLVLALGPARAQQRPSVLNADTTFFRPVSAPAHLKPIERGPGSLGILGSTYFYGGRRLRSPNSLEIPFYELNDPTVMRHFQLYKTLNTVGGILSFVPLIYLLGQGRRGISQNDYWTIYGVSIGASLGVVLIANGQMNKAINAYNRRLAGVPSVGFSVVPTLPLQPLAVGAGVSWRF